MQAQIHTECAQGKQDLYPPSVWGFGRVAHGHYHPWPIRWGFGHDAQVIITPGHFRQPRSNGWVIRACEEEAVNAPIALTATYPPPRLTRPRRAELPQARPIAACVVLQSYGNSLRDKR